MKTTALLLVDIQESFKINRDRWDRRGNLAFEQNVSQLLDAWRASSQPRIFIMHTDPDRGFRDGDAEFRLMDFMRRRADEPLLVKSTRNSFTSTDLERRLDAMNIERVAITGIQMEQCCETTASIAADLGYEVDFVMDATQTFPIRNRTTGREISADALIERTDFVLRDRFARIVSSEQLIAELKGDLVSSV